MKLWSSYIKEMKIAARGFYFYIEIVIAIILLAVILLAVDKDPKSKVEEYIFYDMPAATFEAIQQQDIENGLVLIDDKEFELDPVEFSLTNKETGETKEYSYSDEKTVTLAGAQVIDSSTGKLDKTVYYPQSREDMLRLTYQEKASGGMVYISDNGELLYELPVQGYETERYTNLLYIIHNQSIYELADKMEAQEIRALGTYDTLDNQENMIPVFVVFMGTLMGLFIVMAYIFLDKGEGVVRAFAVSPGRISTYLISKLMMLLTTVIVSSSIIAIPVMGAQPDYFFFYLYLIITTFAFTCLGLFIATFFNDMNKSYGVLMVLTIALMLPAFSYFIPSFSPGWLKIFPTYYILFGFKDILLGNSDISFILITSALFIVGGIIFLFLANARFKKTLAQ